MIVVCHFGQLPVVAGLQRHNTFQFKDASCCQAVKQDKLRGAGGLSMWKRAKADANGCHCHTLALP